ncbi:MAG: hypothetical protein ABH806_03365 [Candidatus Omnitrophota bacterium]
MKKNILILFIGIAAILPFFMFRNTTCPLSRPVLSPARTIDLKASQDELLHLLKIRNDALAEAEAERILSVEPNDICALWAKAEVLRRAYKFKDSQKLLKIILIKSPDYAPSLISLAYIRYHDNDFASAIKLLKGVLRGPDLEREDKAMAYMLIGIINARKASQGGFLSKVVYGARIMGYFEKAMVFAPDLPEVHLGLGTYCLLAPRIAGGNLDRAIEELKWAIRLAPDFATPNARLAQAYKEKGDLEQYRFYLKRAKELDPVNEVVRQIEAPA